MEAKTWEEIEEAIERLMSWRLVDLVLIVSNVVFGGVVMAATSDHRWYYEGEVIRGAWIDSGWLLCVFLVLSLGWAVVKTVMGRVYGDNGHHRPSGN